jgi:hypothetical protein
MSSLLAFDQGYRLSDEIKLAFFRHPLMRFGGAFDSILEVVAFGRQELRDFIDRAHRGNAERSRCVIDRLTDFEFVAGHDILPSVMIGSADLRQRSSG